MNYSLAANELLQNESIQLDLFKCPAWPETVTEARRYLPTYVHFPLRVDGSRSGPRNTETNDLADLNAIEAILKQSDASTVNLHLSPSTADYDHLAQDTTDSAYINRLLQDAINDIEILQRRFGEDKVIVENVTPNGTVPHAALDPAIITQVIEATNSRLLLDISHARITALTLGLDERTYLAQLPVHRIGEIHITGVHLVDEAMIERFAYLNVDPQLVEQFRGRYLDHLPLTGDDWELFDWCMSHIRDGTWAEPWVVTFEYGGVGGIWEQVGQADVMREQVPRLFDMVKRATPVAG